MPRLDHRLNVDALLTEQGQVLLTLLRQELNALRQEVGLPPHAPAHWRALIEQAYLAMRQARQEIP